MTKNLKNKKAFSMVEMSIVLLIIGVLIALVASNTQIYTAYKLQGARQMTQSSPVAITDDLSLWIDATSKDSFLYDQSNNGASVTTWYDINPQLQTAARPTIASQGTAPIYTTNAINNLPAVRFAATGYYHITNLPVSSNTTKTIFAVVKQTSAAQRNYIYDNYNSASPTSCAGISQHCFILESNATPKTATSHAGASLTTGSFTIGNPYVITIVENSSSSFFRYNGTQTSSGNIGSSVMLTNLRLGGSCLGSAGYSEAMIGLIGEFIIFDRILKTEEYVAIESYLGRKWGIKVN